MQRLLFGLVALSLAAGVLGCKTEAPPEKEEARAEQARPEPKQSSTEKKEAAPDRPVPKPAEKPEAQAPEQEKPGKDKRAPDKFTVKMETTKRDILIDVHRDWAPRGADRFYTLVTSGFYEDVAFFRVIKGFMAQTGISGNPDLNAEWRNNRIEDDPVVKSNTRGMVSFATSGPNSRTTQFFINFGDNSNLDSMGFSPFGKVRDMSAVDEIESFYGEGEPRGKGPSQGRIQREGNAYLKKYFPKLDYILTARITED